MALSTTLLEKYLNYKRTPSASERVGVVSTLPHNSKLTLTVTIEIEEEDDGRWIAEAPELPGVMVYGDSEQQARDNISPLILRVIADRLERGEHIPLRVLSNASS
jgi:predicted RNase H-like HicB family nuclease